MGRLIKSCPFCGGRAKIKDGVLVKSYHIICTERNCGADVWFYGSEFDAANTIWKWNRRDDHGEIHTDTENH